MPSSLVIGQSSESQRADEMVRAPGWDDLDHPVTLAPAPRRRTPLSNLWRLRSYAMPLLGTWLVMLACMAISTAMSVAVPLVTQRLVDGPIRHGDRRGLLLLGSLALLLGAAEALFWFFRRLLSGPTGLGVETGIRTELYAKLQRLPMEFHSRWQSGQLLSRIMSDLGTVRRFVAFGLTMLLITVVQVVVVISMLMRMYWPLGLVVLASVVPIAGLCLANERRYLKISRRAQDLTGEVADIANESAQAHRVVKAFGRADHLFGRFDAKAVELQQASLQRVRNTSSFWTFLEVIPTVTMIVVLGMGAHATAQGRITIGTLVAFITLVLSLVWPIAMLGFLSSMTQDAMTAADRVCEILDEAETITDGPQRLVAPSGALDFHHVCFRFPDADEDVLHDVNLSIAPGETVALVGGTGSGKTTLTALVPRLFDVTAGSITIDGVDVRELQLDDLRQVVATAFEDPTLFSMSARENLTLGRPDATDAEIAEAIEVAQAHFVHDLPWGLDTRLGEQGMSLSGGQRQRLALARAVITRPRVLVLDDTLSALDIHTEALVEEALKRVLVGVTGIVVAHRASTVMLADRVALLQSGTITHVGTHAELLATVPAYRELLSAEFDAEANSELREPVEGSPEAEPLALQPHSAHIVPTSRIESDARGGQNVSQVRDGAATPTTQDGAAAPTTQDETPTSSTPAPSATPATDPTQRWRGIGAEDAKDADLDQRSSGFLKARSRALLGSLLRPYFHLVWILAAAVIIENLARLSLPWLVRRGIDKGIPPMVTGSSTELVTTVALMVLALVLQSTTRVWFLRASGKVGQEAMLDLRRRVFRHFQQLDVAFHDRYTSGRVTSRMTSDMDAIAELLAGGFDGLLTAVLTLVGTSVMLLVLDVQLGLMCLASMVLVFLLLRWFSRESTKVFRTIRERSAQVIVHFVETMTGIRAVQSYRREPRNQLIFAELADLYRKANIKSFRLFAIFMPGIRLIGNLTIGLVLLVGGLRVMHGSLSIGVLTAFLLYLRNFYEPMQDIGQFYNTFQSASSALEKLSGVLEQESEVVQSDTPTPLPEPRGKVDFDHVNFGYTPERTVLPDLDLHIPAGQTVALVGTTGAGKTTIAKLVARFYDPTRGRVCMDDVDLRELSDADLRRAVVLVTQENFMFTGTIAENIEFGRPGATRDEVEAAARAVGAHHFIEALPDGYDTQVAKRGERLSAGQRQLVAFSRAFLADPAVLILDEATSSLDIPSERLVQHALQTLLKSRTAVIIAHRLSTVEIADRVLVLEHGRIIEDGSPAELMAQGGGRYASLHEAWIASLA